MSLLNVRPGDNLPHECNVIVEIPKHGGHAKPVSRPPDKLSPLYHNVLSYKDLPEITLEQIKHFFQLYKALEPGKWVKIKGWEGVEAAHAEIMNGLAAYKKLNFISKQK